MKVTCENEVIIDSSTLHHVVAQTDKDERVFQTFNRLLQRLEDECRCSSLAYWDIFMKGVNARTAENDVLASESFRQGFDDVPVLLENQNGQYVLYSKTIWPYTDVFPKHSGNPSVSSDSPPDNCPLGRKSTTLISWSSVKKFRSRFAMRSGVVIEGNVAAAEAETNWNLIISFPFAKAVATQHGTSNCYVNHATEKRERRFEGIFT